MLATLILGIAAGVGAPHAEPHVKKALENILLAEAPMTKPELLLFSFSLCLLAAAVLSYIFGNGSAFALAFGAALGVFGPKIIERIKQRPIPDYDDDA